MSHYFTANRRLSFGFHRAEVLGALLSILILCSLTFLLVYLAYRRLTADKLEVNTNTFFFLLGSIAI